MVETISSLDTIKGQGIEIPSEWKWGQLYGKQMQAGFKNTVTRSISGSASNFLSQLSGLLVIWAGAVLVLQGKINNWSIDSFQNFIWVRYWTNTWVGNYVAKLSRDGISLERISDIIDNPKEISIGKDLPPIPPVNGKIEFNNVNFRFSDSNQ